MKVLKHSTYLEDSWVRVAADQPLPGGDIIIDAARLEQLDPQRPGRLGLLIQVDGSDQLLTRDLARFTLIAIPFEPFTDGRGYSLARLLRRHGYGAELRAVGALECDQVEFLLRCGFDSLEVASAKQADDMIKLAGDFPQVYQDEPDRLAIRHLRMIGDVAARAQGKR